MTIPKIQGVIEPCSQDRRWLTRVLGGAEYDYRLSGARLVTRGPNKNRGSRDDPEREDRHDYDGEYSANDIYGPLCLCSTRHGWKLR